MKEVLHIFRKDVRAARLQIVLGVVWITLFAYLDAEDTMTPSTYQTPLHQWSVLLTIFLPVVWWLLIAAGIFQEVIPGDTQFWLTRPYSRRRLIAAKLLFIAVFVNSALLLSDVFIMSFEAVPFTVGDLLQRQIGITVLAILPALALASVSRGLGQFVLIALLMVVGYVLESILISSWLHNPISIQVNEDSPQEDYTQLFLMALIFAGFLWWQYRRRMATLGRSIFAALILVALPLLFFVSPRAIYYIWTRDNVAEQPALAALTLHLETSGARKLPSTSGPLTEQRTFEAGNSGWNAEESGGERLCRGRDYRN